MIDGANNKFSISQPPVGPFIKPQMPKPAIDNTFVFHQPLLLQPKDKMNVASLADTKAIASLSFADNDDSPQVEKLKNLGDKYKVPFKAGEDIGIYQTKVVRAIVIAKAKEHGIPQKVALGMAGLESEMKMWDDIGSKNPSVIEGRNMRGPKGKKYLSSSDWGVMQVNDKAHPGAFPKAKQDVESNIDYGLNYLTETRKTVKGSLGYGFGDWDRTIGAYNLGHNPSGKTDHKIARRYIMAVKGSLD